ncbi:membrane-bound lytic murein transglycosylase C [Luminiphilus syltensis NOR5-1B]|uniref:Membrane-bound lytic murein transglycosylase C n=1 Tax=Luminiphilus syltensis NOR5-1B TaxID=565045 RepID=B8KTY1_9GAMM|nr:membrane-bound lytic murein transglycosylase C [Luminiphilus syltensis NOR5-1B]
MGFCLSNSSQRLFRTVRTLFLSPILLLLLSSCASNPEQAISAVLSGDPERIAREIIEVELEGAGLPSDFENLPELVRVATTILRDIWGEREPEIASEHRYVKYSNAYEARAIIDFDEGWLQVETVAEEQPLGKLRDAMVSTLLTSRDMRVEDIFTDAEPDTDGEPFLLGQVLDHDGEAIRWRWRAERYADYLIANELRRLQQNGRSLHLLRVSLVDNHLQLRELEYADQVIAASRQYGISPTLIYAVIEVESAFNPYAVSPANAFGLMQVVPATAGRDVFERIKKQPGEPTRQQLFEPPFNIDIGSAYLHLLDDVYLSRIRDHESRHFATIAAYNGGAGGALRTFDSDKNRAVERINRLTADQVYDQLVTRHPFAETRNYLKKVRAAEQRYR